MNTKNLSIFIAAFCLTGMSGFLGCEAPPSNYLLGGQIAEESTQTSADIRLSNSELLSSQWCSSSKQAAIQMRTCD